MVIETLPDDQLLDAAPDAMVVVDPAGLISVVNRRAESLFGYAKEELIGQPIETLVPDRLRVTHFNHRQGYERDPEARTIHQALDCQLIGLRADGSEFPAEISLSPIESKDGVYIASAIRDVTGRQLEDQKLRQLLDSASDAIVVVDERGLVTLVNEQTESLFHYTRQELVGRPVEMLLPQRFQKTHPAHRDHYVSVPNARPMGDGLTLYGKKRDGAEFPIEISLSPVRTPEGLLVSAAIRDVTAHIDAKRALETARQIAENATTTKSRFLAAASHDLRQPLQSLGLYLSVLDRLHDSDKQHEVSAKMRSSLDTMAELLDALLDISKLDAGTLVPNKESVALAPLLERIVVENVQQAQAKGLELTCDTASCAVFTDPTLLQRIVDNFVTNAIRYTEQGSVAIECKMGEGQVDISVVDTGAGIPEPDLEKIFEEYFQLDNPDRNRKKGLGLGLAIVRNIAQLLDHPISVSSTLGVGSRFSVSVPTAQNSTTLESESTASANLELGGTKVLVVDDDPVIVDATAMLLESAGASVFKADSAEEALQQLDQGLQPELLISDFRLPGLNGVEFIRQAHQRLSKVIPSILMTGDTSASEVESADLPKSTLMHKPVDTDLLLQWFANADD